MPSATFTATTCLPVRLIPTTFCWNKILGYIFYNSYVNQCNQDVVTKGSLVDVHLACLPRIHRRGSLELMKEQNKEAIGLLFDGMMSFARQTDRGKDASGRLLKSLSVRNPDSTQRLQRARPTTCKY
jgi:hypothetical protein